MSSEIKIFSITKINKNIKDLNFKQQNDNNDKQILEIAGNESVLSVKKNKLIPFAIEKDCTDLDDKILNKTCDKVVVNDNSNSNKVINYNNNNNKDNNTLILNNTNNASFKRELWTEEEDEILKKLFSEAVSKNLEVDWNNLAQKMTVEFKCKHRVGKQLRERWVNHLDPSVVKDYWTEEEERMLFLKQKEYGNKWSDIAKWLPGRTDNSVKNYFYSKLRRQVRFLVKVLVKNKLYESNNIDAKKYEPNFVYKLVKDLKLPYQSVNKTKILEIIEEHIKGQYEPAKKKTVDYALINGKYVKINSKKIIKTKIKKNFSDKGPYEETLSLNADGFTNEIKSGLRIKKKPILKKEFNYKGDLDNLSKLDIIKKAKVLFKTKNIGFYNDTLKEDIDSAKNSINSEEKSDNYNYIGKKRYLNRSENDSNLVSNNNDFVNLGYRFKKKYNYYVKKNKISKKEKKLRKFFKTDIKIVILKKVFDELNAFSAVNNAVKDDSINKEYKGISSSNTIVNNKSLRGHNFSFNTNMNYNYGKDNDINNNNYNQANSNNNSSISNNNNYSYGVNSNVENNNKKTITNTENVNNRQILNNNIVKEKVNSTKNQINPFFNMYNYSSSNNILTPNNNMFGYGPMMSPLHSNVFNNIVSSNNPSNLNTGKYSSYNLNLNLESFFNPINTNFNMNQPKSIIKNNANLTNNNKIDSSNNTLNFKKSVSSSNEASYISNENKSSNTNNTLITKSLNNSKTFEFNNNNINKEDNNFNNDKTFKTSTNIDFPENNLNDLIKPTARKVVSLNLNVDEINKSDTNSYFFNYSKLTSTPGNILSNKSDFNYDINYNNFNKINDNNNNNKAINNKDISNDKKDSTNNFNNNNNKYETPLKNSSRKLGISPTSAFGKTSAFK